MADPTKDRDDKPVYEQELPDDEDLQEEPEDSNEVEGEEGDAEAFAAATASGGRRRFGFGRGDHAGEQPDKHHGAIGSVRETHERVHIDDRPSAVYALVCAGALLGVLILSWAGGLLPPPATPTLTPLVVPTSQATVAPSASASVAVSPAASVSP